MQMSAGQGSLDDGLRPTWFGRDERLELIRASIDWDAVGARLASVHASQEGRPAFPTMPMVRVLLLQRWTGAGDEAMARSLRSDLSHLSFTGLGMERRPPDASTICRFRNLLAEADLASEVFEEIASQLADRGLALKKGSIVDSTIVETAVPARPGDRARGRSDHPEAPLCDPDAGTDRKGRLGFKAHITMDRGSQVVRRAKVVKANETDFTAGEAMIMGDEKEFYTDKGYSRNALSQRLGSRGDQGSDDAAGQQAPRAAEAVGEAPQRVDQGVAGAGGIGLRHVQAQLGDAACALHGPRQGVGADLPHDDGLQPAEDAQADGGAGAGVGPHRLRAPSARPEASKQRRNRRIRRGNDGKQPFAPRCWSENSETTSPIDGFAMVSPSGRGDDRSG